MSKETWKEKVWGNMGRDRKEFFGADHLKEPSKR